MEREFEVEVGAIADVVKIVVDLNPFIGTSLDVKPVKHRKQKSLSGTML